MITLDQAIKAILIPAVLAALLAASGHWRKWRWIMPSAAGAAFLVGYGLLQVPRLPPIDGSDWLFWMAIPVTVLGLIDALLLPRWGWIFGMEAGAVAFIIVHPLVPQSISPAILWTVSAASGLAGAAGCYLLRAVESRLETWAVMAGLCVAVGGAAVAVMTCGSASIGVRGLAATAALAAVSALSWGGVITPRSVAIVVIPIMAGILAGGRFYADLTWVQFAVLMGSPVMLLAGIAVPRGRKGLAGLVAVLAVIVAVSAIVVPAALAAKHASETHGSDPYEGTY